ncbi:MAG: rod shape-determining protein MreD [Clostridiales bacterium]|nr:rod shape-determining protein MreD [Clostridiales bacterium]
MKKRYLFILALLIFLLQTTFFQLFRIMGVVPNLLLISIVISVLILDNREGIYLAVFFGLLQDIFASKAIGISILIYLIISLVLYSIKEVFLSDYKLSAILSVFISTISYHLLYYSISILLRDTTRSFHYIVEIGFLEAMYNTVVIYVFYGFVFNHIKGYEIR